MSGKSLFAGLLALASLALASGCERTLSPDPPANLEKANEIRAGLVDEALDEEVNPQADGDTAAKRLPGIESLTGSPRQAQPSMEPRQKSNHLTFSSSFRPASAS